MIRSRLIYLFFSISLMVAACGRSKQPDVSNIHVSVNVLRFDRDLAQLKPAELAEGTETLKARYGGFYNDYMERIIGAGPATDTGYFANLRTVLASRDYQELKKDVNLVFANMNQTDFELTDAFRRLKYYFPKATVPKRFISFISGFAYQVIIGEDYVGIGLDMFLGADSRFYPSLRESIPLYMSRTYHPRNITPRVVESYVREELFPDRGNNETLLAKMIYEGKLMYFLDQLLPATDDSLKINYTTRQIEWARTYEKDTWAYFIDQNLLYETDYTRIQKFTAMAPFTPGIGEHNESAPKLGTYIGWQIVRHYMEAHPELNLEQLLNGRDDAQKILNESKYRP